MFLFFASSSFGFEDRECFLFNYSADISHKVKPLGIFRTHLKIEKAGCQLSIESVKFRIFKKHWQVDVCRTPVHIKYGQTNFDVLKKSKNCTLNKDGIENDSFCSSYFELMDLIQDDGLIFAEGVRENLLSDHGKTFCAFQLLKGHLDHGNVYGSDFKNFENKIITDEPKIEEVSPVQYFEKVEKNEPTKEIPIEPVKDEFPGKVEKKEAF